MRHTTRAKAIAGLYAERNAKRAEREAEAEARRARIAERLSLIHERDLAIQRLQVEDPSALKTGAAGALRDVCKLLGLPPTATTAEQQKRARLLMRLLHPDRSINLKLRGTAEGDQIEAAFKVLGNLAV